MQAVEVTCKFGNRGTVYSSLEPKSWELVTATTPSQTVEVCFPVWFNVFLASVTCFQVVSVLYSQVSDVA